MKSILKGSLIAILSIFLLSGAAKSTSFEINGVWTLFDYDKAYSEMFNNMSTYAKSNDDADFLTDDYIKDYLDKELDKTYIETFIIKNNFYISITGSEKRGIKTTISPITIKANKGNFSFTLQNKKLMKFNIIDKDTIQLVGSDVKASRVKTKSQLGTSVDRQFLTGTWKGDYRVMFNKNLFFGEKLDGVHTYKDLAEDKGVGMPFDFSTFDLNKSSYLVLYKKGEYKRPELIKFIDEDNYLHLPTFGKPTHYRRINHNSFWSRITEYLTL